MNLDFSIFFKLSSVFSITIHKCINILIFKNIHFILILITCKIFQKSRKKLIFSASLQGLAIHNIWTFSEENKSRWHRFPYWINNHNPVMGPTLRIEAQRHPTIRFLWYKAMVFGYVMPARMVYFLFLLLLSALLFIWFHGKAKYILQEEGRHSVSSNIKQYNIVPKKTCMFM